MRKDIHPLPIQNLKITDHFWGRYLELVRTSVIPYQWEALHDRIPGAEPSYCIRNLEIAAGRKKGTFGGFVFQDSDLYKWLEAVSYSLIWHPDEELERKADEVIQLLEEAQQPDGYLDSYYIINGLENRFTNLEGNHELYCLGHMLEAAVAYAQATGKTRFLKIGERYADCAAEEFGREPGKRRGYPGHEVAEMALVKLYAMTGKEKYLKLASYFIEERGQKPLYFAEEDKKYGRKCFWEGSFGYRYYQAAEPVRSQTEAEGHAVRAVYLYSGMADVAKETGDEELFEVCRRIWKNITEKKMYITGAIGASSYGEAFSYDYHLPNDLIYGETCAAIGLVFLAQRLFEMTGEASYADVMERALYNGVISGMSLDGTSFFYVNPLEVEPRACREDHHYEHVKPVRQKWFGCACCPPNLARLLASIAHYACAADSESIYMNLYLGGQMEASAGDSKMLLEVDTEYPWNGKIKITVSSAAGKALALLMWIPGWCPKTEILYNGKKADWEEEKGYAVLRENFQAQDTVEILFDMKAELIAANPNVRADIGKAAVMRGPLVYCLEEADNGKDLHRIRIPEGVQFREQTSSRLGGAVLLTCAGLRETEEGWKDGELYRPFRETEERQVTLTWIPYYAWANRGEGEMQVWTRR